MADKIKLSEIRAKFPMYGDVSDAQLLGALHAKYYSDIPRDKFLSAIDYDTSRQDPTEGMSGLQTTLAGIGKGMTDLARGAGQRLGLVSQDDVDAARANDEALMRTTGGKVGNVAGKIAVALPTAFIPGANTIAGAGLIGAGQGFLEPTATGESVIKNMAAGAAGGVAGNLAGRAIKAGYQGVKGLIDPFTEAGQTRIAGRVLERFAKDPDAVRAATGAPTATGAMPTLSEAARDPGVAVLERSLAQQDPQIAAQFGQRVMDNNAARVSTLADLAGRDGRKEFFEAARDATADQLYGAARKAAVNPAALTPEAQVNMAEFAKRIPSSVLNEAKQLAAINGEQMTDATSVQGMHWVKKALDGLIAKEAGPNGNSSFLRAYTGLKNDLLAGMDNLSPQYAAARQTYAQMSEPINQMNVADLLLKRATSATNDLSGNPRLQANAFARLLNDEPALVAKATGANTGKTLGDVLSPDQLGKINAVRNELELASNLSTAANGPGSQTAKSLASQNLLRQILGPTGLPQSWAESTLLSSFMRPAQFVMKEAEPRIQNKLALVLLNPDSAKDVLAAAAPAERNAILQLLQQYAAQLGQQGATRAAISQAQELPAPAVAR